MIRLCHQINLQRGYGGGEVYTVFLAHALDRLGVGTVLWAHPEATFWGARLPASAQVVAVRSDQLAARLAEHRGLWALFHTLAGAEEVRAVQQAGGLATAMAHLPWHDRDPAQLAPYDLIVPVSNHVAHTLQARGLSQVYEEPLYGLAHLADRTESGAEITANPVYDWDRRKVRERVLRHLYPLWWRLQPRRRYAPARGIRLGIVSHLTPLKQFPALFSLLAPHLARHPSFHLEVFGSGGYASVRDLRRALAPIAERVRWWGHQNDVVAAYRRLDYLLTGLPEKEALGLNAIEAQTCGLPVLAVRAPPFTETVAEEVSGLFYADPRSDGGAGFGTLLARLEHCAFTVDQRRAALHLERFSEDAFAGRVARLVAHIAARQR